MSRGVISLGSNFNCADLLVSCFLKEIFSTFKLQFQNLGSPRNMGLSLSPSSQGDAQQDRAIQGERAGGTRGILIPEGTF